jgi:hypothetical protein
MSRLRATGSRSDLVDSSRRSAALQGQQFRPQRVWIRILTEGSDNFGWPHWSSGGRKIVYRGAGGNGNGIFVLDVASKALIGLAAGAWNEFLSTNPPSWWMFLRTFSVSKAALPASDIAARHPRQNRRARRSAPSVNPTAFIVT